MYIDPCSVLHPRSKITCQSLPLYAIYTLYYLHIVPGRLSTHSNRSSRLGFLKLFLRWYCLFDPFSFSLTTNTPPVEYVPPISEKKKQCTCRRILIFCIIRWLRWRTSFIRGSPVTIFLWSTLFLIHYVFYPYSYYMFYNLSRRVCVSYPNQLMCFSPVFHFTLYNNNVYGMCEISKRYGF